MFWGVNLGISLRCYTVATHVLYVHSQLVFFVSECVVLCYCLTPRPYSSLHVLSLSPRHKSDSDLQQSLLMQQQQQQPFPLVHHLGSPQHTYPNHKCECNDIRGTRTVYRYLHVSLGLIDRRVYVEYIYIDTCTFKYSVNDIV